MQKSSRAGGGLTVHWALEHYYRQQRTAIDKKISLDAGLLTPQEPPVPKKPSISVAIRKEPRGAEDEPMPRGSSEVHQPSVI